MLSDYNNRLNSSIVSPIIPNNEVIIQHCILGWSDLDVNTFVCGDLVLVGCN